MRIIFWAGDSTNTTNKADRYPQTGIAQAFDRYTSEDVVIYNHSINGRSTKSFIDEGRLARIGEEISSGDFLFIQFGHNDEKEQDPARYTHPYGDFIDNLGRFVSIARKKGAYPLLITPVERRHFLSDGKTLESPSLHEDYVEGILEASHRYEVPVIDLWTLSRELLSAVGDEASVPWFMHLRPGESKRVPEGQTDDTHLKYEGAMAFGRLLAEALCKLNEPYGSLVDREVLAELKNLEARNTVRMPDPDLIDEKAMNRRAE